MTPWGSQSWVLNRFGESWPEMRRKPGTDTKFPAPFAGNWLSVPGFAQRICSRARRVPKPVKHPATAVRRPPRSVA